MNKANLLARIDAVLAKGKATVESVGAPPAKPYPGYDADHAWVRGDLAAGFRAAGLAVLTSIYGTDSHFVRDFDNLTDDKNIVGSYKRAWAVMDAAREQVQNDWFYKTRALVAADVFGDILEMAEYLLSEGYKDAAAVLIGGSLEGHLRGLAARRQIDTHSVDAQGTKRAKKADGLNAELYKANAYLLGDSKAVTAWLDLRNNAAHAHYSTYTTQVDNMLSGVRDFIARVPA